MNCRCGRRSALAPARALGSPSEWGGVHLHLLAAHEPVAAPAGEELDRRAPSRGAERRPPRVRRRRHGARVNTPLGTHPDPRRRAGGAARGIAQGREESGARCTLQGIISTCSRRPRRPPARAEPKTPGGLSTSAAAAGAGMFADISLSAAPGAGFLGVLAPISRAAPQLPARIWMVPSGDSARAPSGATDPGRPSRPGLGVGAARSSSSPRGAATAYPQARRWR